MCENWYEDVHVDIVLSNTKLAKPCLEISHHLGMVALSFRQKLFAFPGQEQTCQRVPYCGCRDTENIIWVMPAVGLIVARKGGLSELIQFRDPQCIRNWAFQLRTCGLALIFASSQDYPNK